jgi:uncharacterized protein (TIGR02996 family)
MTDAAPLLKMIWDAPYDDGPRLVYADWLEEQGDPDRAEIIRVQIELSQLSEDDPKRTALKRREAELLRFSRGWMKQLKQVRAAKDYRLPLIMSPFERGFPLPVYEVSAIHFVLDAGEFIGAAPLWRIRFTHARGCGSRLAESAFLKRIKEMSLSNCSLGDDDAARIVRSRHLVHLTRLDLRFNDLRRQAAVAIVSSSNLPRLAQVDLRWNLLDREGTRILVERFGDQAFVDPQR